MIFFKEPFIFFKSDFIFFEVFFRGDLGPVSTPRWDFFRGVPGLSIATPELVRAFASISDVGLIPKLLPRPPL